MGWLNIAEEAAAAVETPESGKIAIFMDSADQAVKVKDSDGIVHSIASAVTTVAGRTGAVVLGITDIEALTATLAGKQPLDGDLTAIAALETTTIGRSLIAIADAAAGRAVIGAEATANKDTDGTLAGNSDTKFPSQKAVKTYADTLLASADAVIYKGAIDCSASPKYPAASAGHLYRVSVAGKIGGASGTVVEAGDTLLCNADGTAEGTQAEVGTKWNVIQVNIDGAVTTASVSNTGDFVLWSGTSGKVIFDGGISYDEDGTLAANSNARVPSQKAVKTYTDVNRALLLNEPAMKVPAPSQKTVLQQFQSGHGFEKYAGTGTMSDDTSDFVIGTQSLKVVTLTDESQTKLRKKTVGPYDFTGKDLQFTFKVENLAQIGTFEIYLSSDNLATNNVHYRVASTIQPNIADGEWATIKLSWGDLINNSPPGAIDRTKINFIEFRMEANSGQVGTFHIGEVAMVPQPAAGVVSIVFDDGWASTYTRVRPYMDKYGYRGTACIIRDVLGEASYMTLAQVRALQDKSFWDICAHANTVANHNTGYSNLSDAVVEAEMIGIKKWLIENGFRRRDLFMWPKGLFTASQMVIARRFFNAIRGTTGGKGGSGGAHECFPPSENGRLRTFLCGGSTITAAEVEGALTQCTTHKTWLILTYHEIVASGASGGLQCNEATFKEHIDKVAASGLSVKTICEVLES